MQEMEVQSPPGTPIGYIKQILSWYPEFLLEDANHETILRVKGPFCTCKWCEVNFKVMCWVGHVHVVGGACACGGWWW